MAPYDGLIRHIQNGAKSADDLIELVGIGPVQAAYEAAKTLNGLGEKSDWVGILERTAQRYEMGERLAQMAKYLKSGRDINITNINNILAEMGPDNDEYLIPATKVPPLGNPFIPSGWEAIDKHLSGWPVAGLVTVGGPTKTGKTTFLLKAVSKFLKRYPDKTVAIFTIEMLASELVERLKETNRLTKQEASRLYLCDRTDLEAGKIVNIAARMKNLGMVGVDFADLIVSGEVDTSSMEHIYRVFSKAAKDLKVPWFLLAQLSSNYQGGIPRPHQLRWTRLAEALSWMTVMLYNPTRDHYPRFDEEVLPIIPGKAYMVFWLVRGGFRRKSGPGAIQVDFRGHLGWHNGPGTWFTLEKIA